MERGIFYSAAATTTKYFFWSAIDDLMDYNIETAQLNVNNIVGFGVGWRSEVGVSK